MCYKQTTCTQKKALPNGNAFLLNLTENGDYSSVPF